MASKIIAFIALFLALGFFISSQSADARELTETSSGVACKHVFSIIIKILLIIVKRQKLQSFFLEGNLMHVYYEELN